MMSPASAALVSTVLTLAAASSAAAANVGIPPEPSFCGAPLASPAFNRRGGAPPPSRSVPLSTVARVSRLGAPLRRQRGGGIALGWGDLTSSLGSATPALGSDLGGEVLAPSDDPELPSPSSLSGAALWHRDRRRRMLERYGDAIGSLERDASSQNVAVPLLILANAGMLAMSLWSGSLHPLGVLLLAIFPGSMFSLWQLQILHDCLHGSMFDKSKKRIWGMNKKKLQDAVLFWGSMPSAFGYYLYLRYGHLTHHRSVGDADKATLAKLFDSDQRDFEDGDVLFVAHRMRLNGEIGPKFELPSLRKGGRPREIKMSISKSGFNLWTVGRPVRNALAFASSFLFERVMLVVNDLVVALTGRNYFFPNKPQSFHDECAAYCRCAVAVRSALWAVSGWKSLLFLYLSETLWSVPPHPACAMFVTNHGSGTDKETGECVPSSSTYAGRWYSVFTLGTNYHCEHHDFPTIPLHKLGELRKIAPEFFRKGTDDNVFEIMEGAFVNPDFYACMDAGISLSGVKAGSKL